MDYPPTGDDAKAAVDSFTPDRVTSDVLAAADSIGADRFAWYGYSWSAVVGLQLAPHAHRLTALVCGGWPPLGWKVELIEGERHDMFMKPNLIVPLVRSFLDRILQPV